MQHVDTKNRSPDDHLVESTAMFWMKIDGLPRLSNWKKTNNTQGTANNCGTLAESELTIKQKRNINQNTRARMSHCTVSQHSSSYLQWQRPACGRVDEMSTGRVSLWAMSFRPLSLSLLLGQSMSLIITASLWYGCDCVHIWWWET